MMHRLLFTATTCALFLQLGCSTTQPKTTANSVTDDVEPTSEAASTSPDESSPAVAESPADWRMYSFNHFVVSLPDTLGIEANEAGLFSDALPEENVGCGGTLFEMTYVKTAREIEAPKGEQIAGEACQLAEYEFFLPIPGASSKTSKARVICKAYRKEMKEAVEMCETIVGSIKPLANDDEPIRGKPLAAPIVREQRMNDAFNDYGDEEYFIPGSVEWWGASLLEKIEVGPDNASAYFLDEGVEARGHGVLLLIPNKQGEYVAERIEDVARLAYKKEATALHVFYQGDEGKCKVLLRPDGGDVERSTSMSCPKDHAKWGTFLLGS